MLMLTLHVIFWSWILDIRTFLVLKKVSKLFRDIVKMVILLKGICLSYHQTKSQNFPLLPDDFSHRKGDWIFDCCIGILVCIFNMLTINSSISFNQFCRVWAYVCLMVSPLIPQLISQDWRGNGVLCWVDEIKGWRMQPHHVSLLPLSWFHHGSFIINGGWIPNGMLWDYEMVGVDLLFYFQKDLQIFKTWLFL